MILQILLFTFGLGVLLLGAELLVRNASLLARSLGIRPMIMGLTVVAFGTSAPEFAVSFMAALTEAKSIALGNIIGSNIANIALILGLTSLIRPLRVDPGTIRREVPWVLGTAVLLFLLSLNRTIGRFDGIVLLVVFAAFLMFYIWKKSDGDMDTITVRYTAGEKAKRMCLTICGLAMLFAGGTLLVRAAVNIAQTLGISELVIGLTVVSVGTSLPELATTVMAALKGESDIGVGNIIGSNVFNTCWVVGSVALVATISVEKSSLTLDMPVMILVSFLLFPFFKTGLRICRTEGLILLTIYGLYVLNCFVRVVG